LIKKKQKPTKSQGEEKLHLSHLFPDAPLTHDPVVTSLCEDTRRAQTGAIFFAHTGSKQNGLAFIDDAIMRGCVAIVVPKDADLKNIPNTAPVIRVTNTRAALSHAAAIMYPGQPEHMVAITGTSGKTSTAYFVQQFLNLLEKRAVSIGTIGVAGAVTQELSLTTPEAPVLHNMLQTLAASGITHAAIEASSQAIIQHRLDDVNFSAASFLNLSRDHLDYHDTMDNYFVAKARLFDELLPPGTPVILNADDAYTPALMNICAARGLQPITFGAAPHADMRLVQHTLSPTGQDIIFTAGQATHQFHTTIAGTFQAMNIMAAMGLCCAMGLHIDDLVAVAPQIIAPPGRLQPVTGHPAGAAIYVDYAHKPGALENVLTALRAHNPNRLICVFGCGGDRDVGKRPLMGEIAARLSDDVIITDDNPRSEDPAKIRAEIAAAAPRARNIGDRRLAIQTAISECQSGDILVIAGKGHEQGQKFATHTEPFDDLLVAEQAIQNLSSLLSAQNHQKATS
jgi:UDP-N-acetylmuramoyl-L-alanyl-D-glutamate--2,6-diaminopimelate ligase